jgi:hypothetical protein
MQHAPRGRDKHQTDSEAIHEVASRTKRIETRLTGLLMHLGIDTPAQRPQFVASSAGLPPRVNAPSRRSSLQEIVDSIPETCHGTVEVFVGSDRIASIDVARTC